MIKKNVIAFMFLLSFFSSATTVLAHVVVRPAEVGVGSFQTFSVGVPNEKDISTVGVRVVIPEGVAHVTPNVKPGWTIDVVRTDDDRVTEINWTNGEIPAGQRDEFNFSAQVPDSETNLQWKAYQTYADSTIVPWDQDPNASDHHAEKTDSGPSSVTKVINDLKTEQTEVGNATGSNTSTNTSATTISFLALAVAIVAVGFSLRKK